MGGSGFTASTQVNVGGASCVNVIASSPTSLSCTTPAHALGSADVEVRNPDGQSSVISNGCGYNPAIGIGTIVPGHGPVGGGTAITITGTGLTAASTISFGGAPCYPVNVLSSTTVTCTTSFHAAGTVSASV